MAALMSLVLVLVLVLAQGRGMDWATGWASDSAMVEQERKAPLPSLVQASMLGAARKFSDRYRKQLVESTATRI